MSDLKKTHQRGQGSKTGMTPPGDEQEKGERATRGTNRDADRSGQSKNQGHGHPREERGEE